MWSRQLSEPLGAGYKYDADSGNLSLQAPGPGSGPELPEPTARGCALLRGMLPAP